MRLALAIGAGLMVLASVWLGEGRWVSPWVSLALGSLIAGGTWAGLGLGALAVAMSGLVLTAPEWTVLGSVGLAAGGVALGLLGREMEKTAPWALTTGAVRSGAWVAGGLLLLAVMPDARLLLLDASGDPLELTARLQDPVAGVAGLVHLPAVMEARVPGLRVLIFAGLLALVAAFVLIRCQVTDPEKEARFGWRVLGLSGLLMFVVGLLGLLQLLSGSVSVPNADLWALSLSKAGQGTAVTGVEVASDARLGLASRPLVDPLRLVAGLLVALWAFGPWRHRTVVRPVGPRPNLLLAIAASCLAALFVSNSVSWVLVGGSVVLFFSVLIAQRNERTSRLGEELPVLVMIGWLVGWLSPAWTGSFG
jgi:hypothetical protein